MNYRDSDIKRLLNTLFFIPTDRTPNFELLIERKHMDHILDKTTDMRNWDISPEDNLELALRTGMDAVCVSALGQFAQVRKPGVDGSNMYVDGMIKTPEDFVKYPIGEEMGKAVDVFEKKVKEQLEVLKGTKVGLAVLVRSVFCNAYLTMGIENFMVNLLDSLDFVEKIMDVFLDYSLSVLRKIVNYPVSLVIIDDDLADTNGTMIGLQRIEKLWVSRTREMTEFLVNKGIPYIGHCCGNLTKLIPIFIDLGYKAIHPIQPNCNDIYKIKSQYVKKLALMGNIDITHPLSFGTPDDVEEDVRLHLNLLSKEGGYILSSSHSIINKIPIENYEAMLRPLHE